MKDREPQSELGEIAPDSPAGQALLFIEENRNALINFGYSLGTGWQSEDAVQETMINIYLARDVIDDSLNIPAYVNKAVKNRGRDFQRSDRLRGPNVPLDAGWYVPTGSPDPEAYLLRNEVTDEVVSAVEQLPEFVRDVVILRDIFNANTPETAKTVGVKSGTVKSRLSRGHAILMQNLRNRGITP